MIIMYFPIKIWSSHIRCAFAYNVKVFSCIYWNLGINWDYFIGELMVWTGESKIGTFYSYVLYKSGISSLFFILANHVLYYYGAFWVFC